MLDLTQSLTEFINTEEQKAFFDAAQATEEEKKGYHIKSESEANYFIKKYKDLVEKRNSVNATAKAEIERYTLLVNSWKEKELNELANTESFFLSILEEYARKELEEKGGKKKSINLIEGTLGFRKQQNDLLYDEEQVVEFCKKHLLEAYSLGIIAPPKPITYDIDKRALKEVVLKSEDRKLHLNGEVLPDFQVLEKEEKFGVK